MESPFPYKPFSSIFLVSVSVLKISDYTKQIFTFEKLIKWLIFEYLQYIFIPQAAKAFHLEVSAPPFTVSFKQKALITT